MTTEHVLAIPRQNFEEAGAFQGFQKNSDAILETLFQPGTALFLPRPAAEEDPTHKQIIPYCLFTHEGKVLCYKRGSSSGEKRLVSKYSIGIGGHINPIDNQEEHTSISPAGYLASVKREIQEEIKLEGQFEIVTRGIINDDSNPVGAVHLGLIHIFELESPHVEPGETAIAEPRFLGREELKAMRDQLESWSQIAVDHWDEILG